MSDPYLSAKALGISELERAALIRTMEVLAREQIVFDMSTPCSTRGERQPEEPDVTSLRATPACDTHLCIGGTMSILMQHEMQVPAEITPEAGDEAFRYVLDDIPHTHRLRELFYGRLSSAIEPTDGIAAIKQFLSGNTSDPWLMD